MPAAIQALVTMGVRANVAGMRSRLVVGSESGSCMFTRFASRLQQPFGMRAPDQSAGVTLTRTRKRSPGS